MPRPYYTKQPFGLLLVPRVFEIWTWLPVVRAQTMSQSGLALMFGELMPWKRRPMHVRPFRHQQ